MLVTIWFAVLLTVGGLALLSDGVRKVVSGLSASDSPGSPATLVRGFREILLVLCGAGVAVGLAIDSSMTVWVSGAILAEELYETSVVIALLERQEAAS